MPTAITKDILESYLHCKFKGHLKLSGQDGSKSDYERMLADQRENVRIGAIDTILAQQSVEQIDRSGPLTSTTLKHGFAFILDAVFEDDAFQLRFDGLKRAGEPSQLGAFHYIPMLFYESRHISKEQKVLLELYGLLLAGLQGRQPSIGLRPSLGRRAGNPAAPT